MEYYTSLKPSHTTAENEINTRWPPRRYTRDFASIHNLGCVIRALAYNIAPAQLPKKETGSQRAKECNPVRETL
jgi:hypothetical protein